MDTGEMKEAPENADVDGEDGANDAADQSELPLPDPSDDTAAEEEHTDEDTSMDPENESKSHDLIDQDEQLPEPAVCYDNV